MENSTAEMSCFARAFHFKNNQHHIFADEYAEKILGEEYELISQSIKQGITFFVPSFNGDAEEGLRDVVDGQLSPSVLGRSAYCEKMLKNEVRLGCRQYVIFACGHDTFAWRNRNPELSIYELDRPQVIEDKKKRIDKAKLELPSEYIPCDLSDESWKSLLLKGGFKVESKSFASLLGITYYLEKYELEKLIKSISEIMIEGSALCFDYPSEKEGCEAKINRDLAREAGERMKAKYSYSELEKLLEDCGFAIYEHLNSVEMTEQYFSDYNSSNPKNMIKAPEGVCYVLAVKKLFI